MNERSAAMLEKNGGSLELSLPETPGDNMTWSLPTRFGTGTFMTECLSPGFTLTVSQCTLQHGLHARLQAPTDEVLLVFGLSGQSTNKNTFFKQGFEIEAGKNYLYWFPDPELVREAPKNQQMDAVVLTIPKERLTNYKMLENNTELLCTRELPGICSRNEEFCFQQNNNSLPISKVLDQILHCPFSGQARHFFLEAKALELIALKLDMIAGKPAIPNGMNEMQMHGVLAAKELLLKDIQNPPSIQELAKVAGMSHPRLSKYFKSVFECTPFELLRQKRLQWARELVGTNELSLTEIAYAVGYANASHFSKAFSDYYGMPPRQYRKRKTANPFYSLPAPIA